jgi:hypothetical protein
MSTQNTRRTRLGTERRLTRYDLFLLLLPLPLLVGASWAAVTSIPLSAGVGLGGLPTAALLVYGLFIDGPTTPETT